MSIISTVNAVSGEKIVELLTFDSSFFQYQVLPQIFAITLPFFRE